MGGLPRLHGAIRIAALLALSACPPGPALAGDEPRLRARADSAACSPLRLRGGGKSGRRTQPAKVPRQFWTKRYQADWDKLKISKRVFDPERGYRRTPYVKIPGSYWAFGRRLPDRAPNMTVGFDIPYEQAFLKSGRCLFHPGPSCCVHESRRAPARCAVWQGISALCILCV
jgi:hypothetical protein